MQSEQPYVLERYLTEAEKAEREAKQKLANRRFGLLIFQVSWMMAFVSLIVVNWQLRFQYESWPPPDVKAMGVILPTIATLSLLVSLVLARRVRKSVAADDLRQFLPLWAAVIGAGALFVVIMAIEWLRVETGTQYSTVFRLLTAFHSFHTIVVGAYMINIWLNARHAKQVDSGKLANGGTTIRYGSENIWPIDAATRMWDFVFVAWLLFYVVLYWWRS